MISVLKKAEIRSERISTKRLNGSWMANRLIPQGMAQGKERE